MSEPAPRKSDLGVRVVSAVVMVAVAGTALWLGGRTWQLFVLAVALICLGEFLRLIWLATSAFGKRAFGALAAFLYVGIATLVLSEMRHSWTDDVGGRLGLLSVLAVVGVVVSTDVGAYFVGRTIGGPKLAPRISPSKTWAGLVGGMAAAAIWGIAISTLFASAAGGMPFGHSLSSFQLEAALSASVLAILAQAGDFFESWLKRRAAVKDSSHFIPGHGGVFDRIDGLIPVAIASAYLFAPPF